MPYICFVYEYICEQSYSAPCEPKIRRWLGRPTYLKGSKRCEKERNEGLQHRPTLAKWNQEFSPYGICEHKAQQEDKEAEKLLSKGLPAVKLSKAHWHAKVQTLMSRELPNEKNSSARFIICGWLYGRWAHRTEDCCCDAEITILPAVSKNKTLTLGKTHCKYGSRKI